MIRRSRVRTRVGTARGSIFSRVIFLCWLIRCPFQHNVNAVVRKIRRLFCQTCRWQVTPNKYTPMIQRCRSGLTMLSRHSVGTYQRNELTRISSGNACQQSSQLVELLWTGSGLKSGIGARKLISTQKKETKLKRKHAQEMIRRTFPKNLRLWGKRHHQLKHAASHAAR